MMKLSPWFAPALCLLAAVAVHAQEAPRATELPSTAFTIKHTWFLGGTGNWDYLTMDAEANRLYIAHGRVVQVVDVETGTLAGEIRGLKDAHDIALDSTGEFGYISDGPADEVKVFDRRNIQIVATIPTGPTPRALAIDDQTGLLFAVCTNPVNETQPEQPAGRPASPAGAHRVPPARNNRAAERDIETSISVIDLATRKRVGQIFMPGRLGFAQSDQNGGIYVLLVNRDQVVRLDANAISTRLRTPPSSPGSANPPAAEAGPAAGGSTQPASQPSAEPESHASSSEAKTADEFPTLDWSHESPGDSMRILPLGSGCDGPRSLAVDGAHQRLFAACNNMKLTVLNAGSGEVVTSLPIGPGTDTVSYDASRGLIYTANGGAQGSLTVIRQDVTDTYAEIQNLPTRQRARTLAFNRQTGEIYLVTDFLGVNVTQSGSIGTLKTVPVEGSFQVLVIGH